MKTYIALLRGINVGGHKKVPMAELRAILSKSGFENVATYIQSGNIILQSSLSDKKEIESRIQKSILDHFGFEVPVIAKTRKELQIIFDTCPFSEEKKATSYFIMLSEIPKAEYLSLVSDITFDNEEIIIIKDCLYFHSSIGYGNSKFNMNSFERKLNLKATSRNYKTMVKLIELSSIF
ncbi:DUF1697 domain-containing protein [Psychroserpens sp.]|uniref:DUF1697 domain-containing protein n=1 Tax=Psychroserpens sp. TaxID=2020870 RepID=UPI002B279B8F|nr:DUF1697 domain-containing protein [Psychroserpens sp.]